MAWRLNVSRAFLPFGLLLIVSGCKGSAETEDGGRGDGSLDGETEAATDGGRPDVPAYRDVTVIPDGDSDICGASPFEAEQVWVNVLWVVDKEALPVETTSRQRADLFLYYLKRA